MGIFQMLLLTLLFSNLVLPKHVHFLGTNFQPNFLFFFCKENYILLVSIAQAGRFFWDRRSHRSYRSHLSETLVTGDTWYLTCDSQQVAHETWCSFFSNFFGFLVSVLLCTYFERFSVSCRRHFFPWASLVLAIFSIFWMSTIEYN